MKPMKKGAAMNLQFVIKREHEGMFWKEYGWCFSIDHATPFNDESDAMAIARSLAVDLNETMRVVLRGPQLVATFAPPRPTT
jgi:hypothetical protein